MVLNSLFPVFTLIAMGMALKHWQLTTTEFLKTADRLVYFIFFPALLFWKIGGSPPSPTANRSTRTSQRARSVRPVLI